MRNLWITFGIVTAVMLLQTPVRAWHGAGHAAVAAIAWEDLKDSPGARVQIESP